MDTLNRPKKTRKANDIPAQDHIFRRGMPEKEIFNEILKQNREHFEWDASTASHNYVTNKMKSRRKKTISRDCDATTRKMNIRDRLREKLNKQK